MNIPMVALDPRRVARWQPAELAGARVAILSVFLILFASYAFFWQGRDWNSASRLMLVYALADRGTIAINGLDRQTGDKAAYQGRFYSDKGPGYSLLAVPVYLAAKGVFRLEPHPLDQPGFAHWPADYWVTLGTSGLAAAATGAILTWLAIWIGCAPVWALLVGLAYGLATPAYVYATLAYGHASTCFFLLAAFALIATGAGSHRPLARTFLAGLLAGYGCVIELSVAPVVLILGGWVLARSIRRGWPWAAPVMFVLGGLGPLLILLGYNFLAYGSPFDMGYAHHTVPRFREVHSAGHPLGLRAPRWELMGPLLWGEYRGLLTYAPVLWLAPLGWIHLWRRGRAALAIVALASCAAVFLVNLSYPEWTGGWCTGPRLLVPLFPFALLGVAGSLRELGLGRLDGLVRGIAIVLALAGAIVIMLCLGVGGRLPDLLFSAPLRDPIRGVAWPLWRGDPIPPWWIGGRFAGNLMSNFWPGIANDRVVASSRQWLQFAPLFLGQVAAIAAAVVLIRRRSRPVTPPAGA